MMVKLGGSYGPSRIAIWFSSLVIEFISWRHEASFNISTVDEVCVLTTNADKVLSCEKENWKINELPLSMQLQDV